MHKEELHNLYVSPDIVRMIKSRKMGWVGHVAHMGDMRNAYGILVRIPEGRKPLGRANHRWEDNIRMDLGEIWWEGAD